MVSGSDEVTLLLTKSRLPSKPSGRRILNSVGLALKITQENHIPAHAYMIIYDLYGHIYESYGHIYESYCV